MYLIIIFILMLIGFVNEFVDWIRDNVEKYSIILDQSELHKKVLRIRPFVKLTSIIPNAHTLASHPDNFDEYINVFKDVEILTESQFLCRLDRDLKIKYESFNQTKDYIVRMNTNNFILTVLKIVSVENALFVMFKDTSFISLMGSFLEEQATYKQSILRNEFIEHCSKLEQTCLISIKDLNKKLFVLYITSVILILLVSFIIIIK